MKVNMENENATRKYRKKIKIRLLDINDPESYICEIFDSSAESEDASAFGELTSLSKSTKDSNGKNYFEILMSNECRKNIQNGSAKESEIARDAKGIENNSGRANIVKTKKNNKPSQKIQLLKDEKDSDLSDEKSLIQVQEKWKCKNDFVNTTCSGSSNKVKKSKVEDLYKLNGMVSSSGSVSQKKIVNILNYFSKTETEVKEQLEKSENQKEIIVLEEHPKCSHKKEDCEIIMEHMLIDSNKIDQEKSDKHLKKEHVKLAPLFVAKDKKAIDLTTQDTHRDFLHKESTFSKASKNKNMEMVINFLPTCHVQQRDDSIYWSLREVSLPSSNPPSMKEIKSTKKFTTNVFKCKLPNNSRNIEKTIEGNSVEIDCNVIKEIKSKYCTLKFDSVIDGLKCKKDKFVNLTKLEILKSANKKSSHQKSVNNNCGNDLLNSLWIEKYKPSSSDLLGNENIVKQLKNWLQSWKAFDMEQKTLMESNGKFKKVAIEDDDDDDDDYFLDSYEKQFKLRVPKSVCLLSGPNGCGKTALVSSLAEELDFNVIEVNASCKRTGKKVLADFQEATRSHKVQHISLPQSKATPKKVNQKKIKKLKKKRSTEDSTMKSLAEEKCRKISLLLIEDADIVFEEHDEGFYSAITSLVQSSKRPFVFITNDPNCAQFDNFKTEECLVLRMEHSPFNKSCALLDVISLLEGNSIKKEIAEFIVRQNQFDLRKSLLDLQFWKAPSERMMMTNREEFDLGRLWWGLSKFLYSSTEREGFVRSVQCKRKRQSNANDEEMVVAKKVKVNLDGGQKHSYESADPGRDLPKSNSSMNSFSSILDVATTLDLIGFSHTEEPIPGMDYKAKDGLSLEENTDGVFYRDNKLREEICNDLVTFSAQVFHKSRNSKKKNGGEKIHFSSPSWEEVRWRNSQEEAEKNLSALVPLINGSNKRSVHLDYLPAIRNICRLEKNRSTINTKRKNRFFHYFSAAGARLSEKSLDISCKVFSD